MNNKILLVELKKRIIFRLKFIEKINALIVTAKKTIKNKSKPDNEFTSKKNSPKKHQNINDKTSNNFSKITRLILFFIFDSIKVTFKTSPILDGKNKFKVAAARTNLKESEKEILFFFDNSENLKETKSLMGINSKIPTVKYTHDIFNKAFKIFLKSIKK